MESCAAVELGAHVAGMRSASLGVPAARPDASRLSDALIPGYVDETAFMRRS
jgi:hypothetical protein